MPEVILPKMEHCPCCNTTHVLLMKDQNPLSGESSFYVQCGSLCHRKHPTASATPGKAIAKWNAFPRALTWITDPPKVPGWYWCRASTLNMQRCVEVYGAWEQLMFGSKRDDFNPQMPVTREGFEWAGPIPEPLEPEES